MFLENCKQTPLSRQNKCTKPIKSANNLRTTCLTIRKLQFYQILSQILTPKSRFYFLNSYSSTLKKPNFILKYATYVSSRIIIKCKLLIQAFVGEAHHQYQCLQSKSYLRRKKKSLNKSSSQGCKNKNYDKILK